MQPAVVWLTGLPASGKSTIARLAAEKLRDQDIPVEVLDGEEARARLSPELGFSRKERETHVRRLVREAARLLQTGSTVLVAAISPYRSSRDEARDTLKGSFLEIHVNCPVEICIERDPKGLYRRAKAGEIRLVTGIDDPYEPPLRPALVIHTHLERPFESAARLLARIASPRGPG